MHRLCRTVTAAALSCVLAAPLHAQEVTCADIEFDAQAVANYADVQGACLDILEKDGVRYAHLKARVIQNWTSAFILQYWHADGTWGPLTRVTPPEGFMVVVSGRPTPVEQLRENQEVHLFLPEGRWEVAMTDVEEPEIEELTFAPVTLSLHAEGVEGTEVTQETAAPAEEAAPAPEQEAGPAADATSAPEEAMAEDAESASSNTLWLVLVAVVVAILLAILVRRRSQM